MYVTIASGIMGVSGLTIIFFWGLGLHRSLRHISRMYREDIEVEKYFNKRWQINVRIQEARLALGLTQQEFAYKIASTPSYISAAEKGEKILSKDTVAIIALAFGLSLQWLEDGQGEMFATNITDNELSATIRIAVEQHCKNNRIISTVEERNSLVTSFYEYFTKGTELKNITIYGGDKVYGGHNVDLEAIRKHIESNMTVILDIIKEER
jgi:transcriptional regulator with XRE-family HTH domain